MKCSHCAAATLLVLFSVACTSGKTGRVSEQGTAAEEGNNVMTEDDKIGSGGKERHKSAKGILADGSPVHEMRAVSWSYPPDITPAGAAEIARRIARGGANTLLTEDNRYLLYDPPPGVKSPEFHFRATPRRESLPATRIVVEAMHAEGIRVIHHVTSCYATSDFMEQHRDWTQRDLRRPDDPLFFGEYGGVWLFCPNNPDFRETFFATAAAFARETGVDGWMVDEVEFLPDWFSCGCVHCRDLFHRDTGMVLPVDSASPTLNNYDDPVWRAWIGWRMTGPARFFADLRARLDAECPGQILSACHAGVADTWSAQFWAADEVAWSPHLSLVFYEAYVRDGIPYHSWPRHAAELEVYAACARGKSISPLALFYSRSESEARFCWALAASRGFGLWGFVPQEGKSSLGPIRAAVPPPCFVWQSERESAFRPATPHSGIALLFSKPSRDRIAPMDNSVYINEWAGWATTMAEANIPYQVVLDRDLVAGRLDGVTLLVMPNAVCLGDAEMQAVRRFRATGGKVVATADTAARDETGALRADAAREAFVRELDVYLSDAPGRGAMRDYARKGTPMPVPADFNAAERIRRIIGQFPQAVPWRAKATEGVHVNILRRPDGSLAVHLLNAPGALTPQGRSPETVGAIASMPLTPARTVVVEIECAARPATAPVLHVFGESDAGKCPFEWDGAVLRLAIEEVAEYAVVEVPAPANE